MSQAPNDPGLLPGEEGSRGRDASRLFVDTGTAPAPALRAGRGGALGRHAVAAVTVLLGGAVIYGMRVMGTGPRTALASSAVVRYDPQEQQRVDRARFQAAVERLAQSGRPVQMAAFVPEARAFEPPPAPVVEPPPAARPKTPERDARAEAARAEQRRTEELTRLAAGLRVQSIMQGTVAVARVNGLPVRVGSVVNGFTVVEIGPASVAFEAEGRKFERSLER